MMAAISPGRRTVRARKTGLTLIEVLVAVVILGSGLVILISAASKCIAVAKNIRNYDTSRELLAVVEREFMDKLLEGDKLKDLNDSVSFKSPYTKYRGSYRVEPIGLEQDGLFEVYFTVQWADRGQNVSEETVTYMQQEPEGGPGGLTR
jgi:prepilin-type N-terminal cleavage/methylation domain-containing protein